MKDTPYFSKKINDLPKGCSQCVKGQKLVLFITGLCNKSCYFCPLSDEKKNKDVIYANERPVTSDEEILEEARISDARGAGITGGDPLLKIERTTRIIRKLKQEFGHFHIHLYTPLKNVTKEKLKALHDAGLDEIRFHPDYESQEDWPRLKLAGEFDWDIGIEIPVIPGTDARPLIEYVKDKVDFINLNELELSDTNANKLEEKGFNIKSQLSYAIEGSEEEATKLMETLEDSGVNVHYCTTRLKDAVQMANRIKRRAKNAAKPFDKITDEGLLIRGAVFPEKYSLEDTKERIIRKCNIPEKHIFIDTDKNRVLTRAAAMKHIKRKLKEPCAIIEEYPTWDQLEIEREYI
ncbi:MAG: radical SAM protein [Candidatus Woesearchaeota archaeon]